MALVVGTLLVAVVVGWLRSGSLERLGRVRLRSRRLLLLAFAAQLLGTVGGGPFHPLGLAASGGLVVAFLLRNRGLRGTGLVALGLLANALVVGVNGAMPVSAAAAARAGVSLQPIVTGADRRHELAGPGTRLRVLGDVVPLPVPVRPEVVSAGDVLVAAGAGQLVAVGMAPGRLRRTPPRRLVGSGAPLPGGGQQEGRQRTAPPPLPGRPADRAAG